MSNKVLNKKIINTAKLVFDFFLPRICPSCKVNLAITEQTVCRKCLSKILYPTQERIEYEFRKKFSQEKLISDFSSLFLFEKEKEIQHILHSLKYLKKIYIGNFLGKLIASNLQSKISNWKADIIIPIPLHSLKKAERGYNQSLYIAKGINKSLKIQVKPRIIKRKKFTLSQTTMNFTERQENVRGAFTLTNKKDVAGKRIILLDDVITTGATISECASLLIDAGAEKVFALSVALAN